MSHDRQAQPGDAFHRAERALHARTALACAAADGVAGRLRAWETGGVYAVCATEPSLAFLATVTGVSSATVGAAIEVVDSSVWQGVTPAVLLSVDVGGEVEAALRAVGLVPRPGPAIAVRPPAQARDTRTAGVHDVLDVQDVQDVDAFLRVLVAGYEVDGPVASLIAAEHRQPMVQRFLAVDRQRNPIAAGAMTCHGEVAVLGGASTLPAFRGQGAQSLLIDHRARLAAGGLRLAVATAMPTSTSAENLRRAGFQIWPRVAWSRPERPAGNVVA